MYLPDNKEICGYSLTILLDILQMAREVLCCSPKTFPLQLMETVRKLM